MSISAIGASGALNWAVWTTTRSDPAAFAAAMTGATTDVKAPDFSRMTPDQLVAEAKAMWSRGEISFDHLLRIQMHSGSYGDDTRGSTVPQVPTDWRRYFAVQLDGAISRAHDDGIRDFRAILARMA